MACYKCGPVRAQKTIKALPGVSQNRLKDKGQLLR